MKSANINRLHPTKLLFALAVLCAVGLSHGQDVLINAFDTADEATQWSRWWGAAPQAYEFDSAVDAGTNANSGSLKATINFDLAAYAGDNQFAAVAGFPGGATLDGSQYTNLVFDLRWSSSSPKRSFGDFGTLEIGFRKADFSQLWLSSLTVPLPPTNGWIHVVRPIDPAAAGIDKITGVVLKMWSGDPGWGQTGTATFWVDNVKLVASTNVSVPTPTLSIERAAPGLRIYASQSGSQYQRQTIRTVNNAYSWIGASTSVTYSATIKDYPGTNNTGFQTEFFLVPGASVPNFETSPDYNEPNIIFLDIQNNASGGAFASFRYKTNLPSGNSMLYNSNPTNGPVGSLAGIGSPQVLGTWSLTFAQDTNVTITTPSGTSTNFTLPSAAAALFAGPLYAYFGIQPNQLTNINQSVLFSQIGISGVATPINETFAGVQPDPASPPNLDPATWERVAENPAGVALIPPDAAYSLNWTVPATGFVLQSSTNLLAGSWVDSTLPAVQIGNRMRTVITTSARPGPSYGFFRLLKK